MSAGMHVSVGGSYGTDSGLRGPDPSQGSTIWVVYTRNQVYGGHVLGYIPLIVASLPIVVDVFQDKFKSVKSYILTWTLVPLLALGLSFTFHYANEGIWIPLFGLFFSLVYLLRELCPKMEGLLKRPLNTLGGVSIWIMALVLSYKGTWVYSFGKTKSSYVRYVLPDITYAQFDYAILVLLTFGTIFLLYKSIKGTDSKEAVILGSFGIICLVTYGLAAVIQTPLLLSAIFILFNLFVFCVGVFRVTKGIFNLDYLKLNTGLIMISSIILLRFFDSDLSLSIRGIVFILIGSSFWLANSKIAKRKQKINA